MHKEEEKAHHADEKTEHPTEKNHVQDGKDVQVKENDHSKHKQSKPEHMVKELEEKLQHMEKQYNEMLDTARRIKAEYENFKKRSDANFNERVENECFRTLKEFLPVYDNLERACNSAGKSQSLEQFEQGVMMILKQFKSILDKFGVEEIGTTQVEFNPEIHEALLMRENDKIGSETVVEIFEKGYRIRGKVIRHAKVVVEKPAASPVKEEQTSQNKETSNDQSSQEEQNG